MSQQQTEALRRLLQGGNNAYDVATVGPNAFRIESGELCMNILCGCCAQYYAYDIVIHPQQVIVKATVPCGGWWGGAIGASKTKNETQRIRSIMQNALQSGTLWYDASAPVMAAPPPPAPLETTMASSASKQHPPPAVPPRPTKSSTTQQRRAPQAPSPASMNRAPAPALTTTTTTHKADGTVIVTKETRNRDGTKTVETIIRKP